MRGSVGLKLSAALNQLKGGVHKFFRKLQEIAHKQSPVCLW